MEKALAVSEGCSGTEGSLEEASSVTTSFSSWQLSLLSSLSPLGATSVSNLNR
jgi:hypothetical protein